MHPIVVAYRRLHPKSRAVDHTTWRESSGAVRRAVCIYCRCVIATSSQAFPETKASRVAREEHWKTCGEAQPYTLAALENVVSCDLCFLANTEL